MTLEAVDGITYFDEFARCPECEHATVGLGPTYVINHAEGCSKPPGIYEMRSDVEVVRINGEAELLPLKYCPDCGSVYRDDEDSPAPRLCEINGAGAELVPVYAFYGGK